MTPDEAFERWNGELTGYLRKTFREDDLAEDAAQQAFSQAALTLPYLGQMPEEALRAWLYAAARNAAIDQLRRRKRLVFTEIPDHTPAERGMDPDDRRTIRKALEKLSETQRELVLMRYEQGYNSAEIASRQGMTSANVRYHLMTAMRRLRRELKEDFS